MHLRIAQKHGCLVGTPVRLCHAGRAEATHVASRSRPASQPTLAAQPWPALPAAQGVASVHKVQAEAEMTREEMGEMRRVRVLAIPAAATTRQPSATRGEVLLLRCPAV